MTRWRAAGSWRLAAGSLQQAAGSSLSVTLSRCLLPAACCLLFLASCAPKPIVLPTGAGTAFPEFKSAYAQATEACSAIKTITAALALSGRAGKTKLRGRLEAGFAAPSNLRLEGLHPFGKPVFILVAHGDQATLVLPRDDRVLRNAPPAAIVEALAGVALNPVEMRWVIAGCGLGPVTPFTGRSYPNGWTAIDSNDGTTYVRQFDGVWRIAAVSREALTISYSDYANGIPATVRIRTTPQRGAAADLTLRLSQVDTRVPPPPEAFEVEVPRGAEPLTLDELRRAGPLGR